MHRMASRFAGGKKIGHESSTHVLATPNGMLLDG
jgi:hypothetical protein